MSDLSGSPRGEPLASPEKSSPEEPGAAPGPNFYRLAELHAELWREFETLLNLLVIYHDDPCIPSDDGGCSEHVAPGRDPIPDCLLTWVDSTLTRQEDRTDCPYYRYQRALSKITGSLRNDVVDAVKLAAGEGAFGPGTCSHGCHEDEPVCVTG